MWINDRKIDGYILSEYDMVDVHMHIIPEVDDGAWDMEMAEEMLRMAVVQGIRKIIATSHSAAFDWNPDKVIHNFRRLKNNAKVYYPEVELFLGCEIACNRSIMETVEAKLMSGIYPTLNNTKYVLMEFCTRVEYEEVKYCVERLKLSDWKPVIAHAERYKNLFPPDSTNDLIENLKDRGCLIQINTYSIAQEKEKQIKMNTHQMLEKKQVDFLGSDAHRTHHRPPEAATGLKYLYDNFEKDYVDQITLLNAIKYFHLEKM